jgi:hypothetical protein
VEVSEKHVNSEKHEAKAGINPALTLLPEEIQASYEEN